MNGAVTDISKRALQRHCRALGLNSCSAVIDGDPDELLIVKSNANYGGDNDRALTWNQRRMLRVPGVTRKIRGPRDYQVLFRRQIAASWWRDEKLTIEKYIRNRQNRIFKLYRVLDQLAVSDIVNPNLIKKADNLASRVNSLFRLGPAGVERIAQLSDFPEGILKEDLRLFTHLPAEYAVLDIAVDDEDRPYPIDLNPTPAGFNAWSLDMAAHLRSCLNSD